MRRILVVVTLLLLMVEPLGAKPWYKDLNVWRMIGMTVGSDIARTRQGHECRQRRNAGIAFCEGGYGPFAAREAVMDAGGLVLDGIGIWGRHMGIKEYSMFADGFTGYNTYVAAKQASIGCSAGTYPVYGTKYNCTSVWKPDLSHVELK